MGFEIALLQHVLNDLLACGLLLTVVAAVTISGSCPEGCNCQMMPVIIISCHSANMTEIPKSLPVAMETFDFSENRLTVIVADSFQDSGVTVTTLNFSRNKIEMIENGAFSHLVSVESVDLSDNRLSTVDQGTFDGDARASIQNMDLSSNRLTEIDGAFSGMSNLSRLDLRNNFITALSEFTFRDLNSLRYLFLTNNRIYVIDKRTFRYLPNLLYLVLKGNPLHEVTKFYFHDPSHLSYIDMSECGLTAIPAGLPISLRYLQMRRNNVTSLTSDAFTDCPDVNIIVLDENKIERIDDGSLSRLRRLQQLWLNENHLTLLPRPFPVSLRRLLVDSNSLTHLEGDTFVGRSELTSLSLAGNRIESVSPYALQHTLLLQSLDLSNNLLQSLHPDTFSTSSKLRVLHLSKNPLVHLDANTFKNLSSLKALSMSYLPSSNFAITHDLLRPLINLHRLDLDNSPALVHSLINTSQLNYLRSLQDLGLANCDLRTLPLNWPVLSRLSQLRLSGNRWHCDESMKWLRDWLLNPDNVEKVDKRQQDIRCASPEAVQNKPLISLTDLQLQSASPLTRDTALTAVPAITLSFPLPTDGSVSTTPKEEVNVPVDETGDFEHHENDDIDMETFAPEDDDIGLPEEDYEEEDFKMEDDIVSKNVDEASMTVIDSNNVTSSSIIPQLSAAVAISDDDEDQRLQRFKLQLIIAVPTVGATVVVVTIIVAAIVYVCRHQRRPPAGTPSQQPARTFIKYKNKNGVLYFSTPAEPADNYREADQCLAVSRAQSVADSTPDNTLHYVVPVVNSLPATPVTPVTPIGYKTRVYRWEDF